MTPVIPKPLGS